MNWSGLPDDVFQLARHLIKKCSSSRLNQNRPLYSISVNGWKLVLLPPVLLTGESEISTSNPTKTNLIGG